MKRFLNFIDKFEATKKVAYLVIAIVALSLFILQTEGAEKLGFNRINISKRHVYKFDQILVFLVLPIVALLEAIQIFLGSRIRQVSNLLKPVISFITSTMNLLFGFAHFVYVVPLSLIIRPGVKKILKELGFYSTERNFIFLNQKGQRRDDHYFPETFELNDATTIKIKIHPKSTGRWRFGFKFSQDKNFPDARYDKEHPLLHLTKDKGNNKLGVHYYREKDSKVSFHELWKNYNCEELTIRLFNSGKSTGVMVSPTEEGGKYGTFFNKWQYFQVFAWADGVSNFQIDARIQIISLG